MYFTEFIVISMVSQMLQYIKLVAVIEELLLNFLKYSVSVLKKNPHLKASDVVSTILSN